MNLIKISKRFTKDAKKYKKKFVSLRGELETLFEQLEQTPRLGTDLGDNIFKIRLASESKGKGKSGGFRVITYLLEETEEDNIVHLITIYDKSETEDISKNVLKEIIEEVLSESEETDENEV